MDWVAGPTNRLHWLTGVRAYKACVSSSWSRAFCEPALIWIQWSWPLDNLSDLIFCIAVCDSSQVKVGAMKTSTDTDQHSDLPSPDFPPQTHTHTYTHTPLPPMHTHTHHAHYHKQLPHTHTQQKLVLQVFSTAHLPSPVWDEQHTDEALCSHQWFTHIQWDVGLWALSISQHAAPVRDWDSHRQTEPGFHSFIPHPIPPTQVTPTLLPHQQKTQKSKPPLNHSHENTTLTTIRKSLTLLPSLQPTLTLALYEYHVSWSLSQSPHGLWSRSPWQNWWSPWQKGLQEWGSFLQFLQQLDTDAGGKTGRSVQHHHLLWGLGRQGWGAAVTGTHHARQRHAGLDVQGTPGVTSRTLEVCLLQLLAQSPGEWIQQFWSRSQYVSTVLFMQPLTFTWLFNLSLDGSRWNQL